MFELMFINVDIFESMMGASFYKYVGYIIYTLEIFTSHGVFYTTKFQHLVYQ